VTWQRVQDVLAEKNESQLKLRKHPHYLKGVYCGRCGSRMIVTHARSHTGRIYPYFACIGRHQKRTGCTMKAVLIDRVEDLVEQQYATVQLPAELLDIIERDLRRDIVAHYDEARSEHTRLEGQRVRLVAEQEKLLQAHYADAVPLELMKREQDRIGKQLGLIEERITATDDHQALVEANLERAMKLARDCQNAYLTAPPKIRRLFNQAFFTRLYVEDDDPIRVEFATPFNVLLARGSKTEVDTQTDWAALEASFNDNDPEAEDLEVVGLKEDQLVGAAGIEPATSRV
jgi:site-specific DNA recombinase